jgi:HEAT repeat protein
LCATSAVLAVLVVGTGCRLAGMTAHENELASEEQALRERNQVYGFMSRLTSSDVKSRNRAGLNFKDLSDPSARLLVHLLIDAFHAGDADVQWRVAAQFANIGPRASPAVPLLVEQSRNANSDIRCRAAFALEKIGPAAREAIPALIHLLDDHNEHVRARSASALRVFGRDAKDAVPSLIRLLDDPHFVARRYAASTLGCIGPEARPAVPALINVVENRRRDDARNAIWALGQMGPDARQAVPILVPLLGHEERETREDRETRLLAIDALGLIRPADENVIRDMAGRIDATDMEWNRHVIDALGRIGMAAVPCLVDLVTNTNAEISVLAIRSLGEMGSEASQAIPALVAALGDRRFGGPEMAAASAPRTVGDWARMALDKIERKKESPGQDLKATEKSAIQGAPCKENKWKTPCGSWASA